MKKYNPVLNARLRMWSLFVLVLFVFVASCKKEEDDDFQFRMESILTTGYTHTVITGNMMELHVPAVDEHGFCYGTRSNPTVSDATTNLGRLSNTGLFRDTLSGLVPGTLYYIRAYVELDGEPFYSDQKTVTTLELESPSLFSLIPEEIGTESARLGGEIVNDGGTDITQRGICWNTTGSPTTGDEVLALDVSSDRFAARVEELACNTTYYYRAYAANSSGTAYGQEVSFSTLDCLVGVPVVATAELTDITRTGAKGGGEVLEERGASVVERGVCWSTSENPTVADPKTINGFGIGTFTSTLGGLACGTVYYVRAYAKNSHGVGYGSQKSFTTSDCPAVLPQVSTAAITDIAQNAAKGGGEVTDDGNGTVTARGICWSITAEPDLSDNHTVNGNGTGTFASQLSGLSCGTTYYVRAYATNEAGTAFGEERSFQTSDCPVDLPVLSTSVLSNITESTAQGGGVITDNGGASVTARGVCWSTSPAPTTADSHSSDGAGGGTFTSQLTGLDCETTYYVRAYATNSAGTGYGEERTFVTASCALPSVSTAAVTDLTSTTASSGGQVADEGGRPVTVRGVCWSTSPDPTVDDARTEDGEGTGSFTSSITGLAPGTTYYLRAYATSAKGTGYGSSRTFTTPAELPTVETAEISSIWFNSARSGGDVLADGGAEVTVRGVCWSTSPEPTVADSKSEDGSGLGDYKSEMDGLNISTTYYVRAYATNEAGTAYGKELSFRTLGFIPL
ncbi:MAG: hypothetical protein R2751_10035 [Bacteroidales bacterium]